VPTLYDKVHGCNAAAVISNSMGDVTEAKSYQEIEAQYGFVNTLLPQDKRGGVRERDWGPDWVRHAHRRPPGMTEDGIERHRLMCTAIIEQGGRVDVWDLARVWLRDISPDHFGYLRGIESVPAEWVEIVEQELKTDPYTVSARSLEDTAQGLYQALRKEMERAKQRIAELEIQQ
jgi:hypothetical protein